MTDGEDDFGPLVRGGATASATPPAGPHEGDRGDVLGPPERGQARPLCRRALRMAALVALVAALILAGTAAALAVSASSRLSRVAVDNLAEPNGRLNVLVVGSDSREQLTREQRRDLGTGNSQGARTDTILLLSVDGPRVAMLSFPRDLFVEGCDGTTGRINAAYGAGGPSCLVETVTGVSGIPVNHFVEVDFLGFRDIVEAVGGVRLCLREPIADADAHIDLPAGCQRLDGKESLGYVRVRKIDDDLGRIGRQQRFLKALARSVAQPATLLDVPRLFATVNATAGALTVDEGLGTLDLVRLARAGAAIGDRGVATHVVPATPATVGGASVLALDEAAARPLFASFRDGTVLRTAATELQPADISLEVNNATSTPGLAARAREVLEQEGFTVTAIGNTDPVDQTVVRFTDGNEAAARYVAQRVPGGARVEPVDTGPPLVLVVGPDAAFE